MFSIRSYVSFIGAGLVIAPLIGFVTAGWLHDQSAFARSLQPSESQNVTRNRQAEIREAYGRLPMNFEVNEGQAAQEVKFLARGHGYQVFLTETESILELRGVDRGAPNVLRFKPLNSVKNAAVSGVGLLRAKTNYLLGNDPRHWQRDLPNYSRVEYSEVYPGIGLAYYGTPRALEYDFIVKPGADPGQITMSVEGAEKIEPADNGDIVLQVAGAKIYHRSPIVYQRFGTTKRRVTSRCVLRGKNRIGFEIGGYDATKPLVIDPAIDYSTFLGGASSDEGLAIAIDSSGNAYVTGTTHSNNFNTLAPLQTINRGGKDDAFITKISASGSELVYSTYLGGSGEDSGRGIAVNLQGEAYVAGITNSQDFNVRNALQPAIAGPGEDAFIAKINASGTNLIFSTYLGGSNIDQAFAITLDLNEDAYVAGSTASTDFKTKSPLQATNRGKTDLFVAKIKSDGSDLRYSTYLGGSDLDEASGIAVDSANNAYIVGTTSSNNFTVINSLQAENHGGGSDAFVAKINPQGSALIYSTYLGGSGVDVASGVDVGQNSNVYVTGHTFSTDFNLLNPLQSSNRGGADAFITCLEASGSALIYSTYLGGSGGDFGQGIAVDPNMNAYIIGRTISTDFSTKSPLQGNNRGDFDAFVAKVNTNGSGLVFATYLGGDGDDRGSGIAVDNAGNVFITGDTGSSNFNTASPLQESNRGGVDAFVAKISTFGFSLTYSTYLGGGGEDQGLSIALDPSGNAYLTGDTGSNDFVTQNPFQPLSHGGQEAFVTKLSADGSEIAFSTYFGGNGSDTGKAIAVDGNGYCYVAGATTSTNLPTRTPIQSSNRGGLDAFVAKFNATGSDIVYSTYLGGALGDLARGITVDAAGNATIAGVTFSTDFPVKSPFQSQNRGHGDAFVAQLNQEGAALLYSSYLGGTDADEATGIAIDAGGNVYLVGTTASTDFNTQNPLQPNNRGQHDAFVTKVNQNGSGLIYSTYLGGLKDEAGNGIAVDASGNAYVTGSTASNDFGTKNPFQPASGGGDLDAYVTKIDAAGATVVYSSYLGGSLSEVGNAIAVDQFGNCYVAGITASQDFPIKDPLQMNNRGGDEAFITKIDPPGSAVIYSTYLGGSNNDRSYGLAVDGLGAVSVVGATSSPDFNTQFPLLAYGGGMDAFVAKIISEGGFALTPMTAELQLNGNKRLTANISTPQETDIIVALVSSSPGIVSVPSSVTIPAGAVSADFTITGLAVGGPITITATLPASQGGATATATVNVVNSSRVIQAASIRVTSGAQATLPIELISQGNENRLTFSLSIDPTLLSNPQFILGRDAADAALTTSPSQASEGRYGVSIQLAPGQKFESGARQILVISATAISGVSSAITTIDFVDQPTVRRVIGTSGQTLSASYSPATVTIAAGFEGDVAPRQNGGNGAVTEDDWTQAGRYAAGLETAIAGSEFRRADTAPRATLGNGVITVADWVQTGRYAAALDPIVPSGGPTGLTGLQVADCGPRIGKSLSEGVCDFEALTRSTRFAFRNLQTAARMVRVVNTTARRGQPVNVTIEYDAQGDENAFGFSLNFNPAQLSFVNAATGADAGHAVINVNNLQTVQGRVGIALALAAGQTVAAGTKKLVTVTFTVAANSPVNSIPITFGDQPVVREVVSANAEVLAVAWTPGAVNIDSPVANVSAASFLGNELASESIVAAFGDVLATDKVIVTNLPLPMELIGTSVRVRDIMGIERQAPLFSVSPMQVNYQLPQGTAPGAATVTVTSGNGVVSTGNINVSTVAPGLFSANSNGLGVAAALTLRAKNGSVVYEPISVFDQTLNRFVSTPIDLGPEGEQVFLVAYGTGLRARSGLSAVNVKIGNVDAEVLFLGPQDDFIGLDQCNIRIPRSLAGRGEVNVVMTVDGKVANTVTINVR